MHVNNESSPDDPWVCNFWDRFSALECDLERVLRERFFQRFRNLLVLWEMGDIDDDSGCKRPYQGSRNCREPSVIFTIKRSTIIKNDEIQSFYGIMESQWPNKLLKQNLIESVFDFVFSFIEDDSGCLLNRFSLLVNPDTPATY